MKNVMFSFLMLTVLVCVGIISSGCQTTRAQRIEKYKSVAKDAAGLGIDLGKYYIQAKYGVDVDSGEIAKEIIDKKIKEKEVERLQEKAEKEQAEKRAGTVDLGCGINNNSDNNIDENGMDSFFRVIGSEEIADKLMGAYGLTHSNMLMITQNFRITNYSNSGAWVDLSAEQTTIDGEDHYSKRSTMFFAFKKIDESTLEILQGADQGGGNYNAHIGDSYNNADYLLCFWVRGTQVKGRSQLYKV